MDLHLKELRALVTGGAKGIGEAICRELSAEGCAVAILDRDLDGAAALAGELGANAHPVGVELTNDTAVARAVGEAADLMAGIDIVVNNAGVNDSVGLDRSPGDFRHSLDKNLVHAFAVVHFALPHLRRSPAAAIVNVASKVAVTGQGGTSAYAAAKGGILALTREWAADLAPHGIRANAVVPAEVMTPLYEAWLATFDDPGAQQMRIERRIPLGARMTLPQEIAAAAAFLASPRSSHTTGQIHFVDGGYTHLDRALGGEAG
ncbi:MAG: SDR family oxidoreductase [Verrucomicrobiales bacterium]